jgi:hypothetical protein
MDKEDFSRYSKLAIAYSLRKIALERALAEVDRQIAIVTGAYVAGLQADFARLTSVHTGDMRTMLDDMGYID